MIVAELIEKLKGMPQDAPVRVRVWDEDMRGGPAAVVDFVNGDVYIETEY